MRSVTSSDSSGDWVDNLPLEQIPRREFILTIDPKRTIKEWVAAGQYNHADWQFGVEDSSELLITDGTDPVQVRVVAFCIGRKATIEQAKQVRERLNLLPIGIEHQLAVGAQHRDAHRELGKIVNLDSIVIAKRGFGSPMRFRMVCILFGRAGFSSFYLEQGCSWIKGKEDVTISWNKMDKDIWFLGLQP